MPPTKYQHPSGAPDPDAYLARIDSLQADYRAGRIHVHLPEGFSDRTIPLEERVAAGFPASAAAMAEASASLFFSLPVAFDPGWSVGPYLASVDRDPEGRPYRFLDLGAQIATQPLGENDPRVARAMLRDLPALVSRPAHSEYQTGLSLRFKSLLGAIAPEGTPRHFVVNTGAESVENAIKAVLLHRVRCQGPGGAVLPESAYHIVSFERAFHGRTLGCLAVTQRRKAKSGFPTFQWPCVPFPEEEPAAPEKTARRELASLHALWTLLTTGRQAAPGGLDDGFLRLLGACDRLLTELPAEREARVAAVDAFAGEERSRLAPEAARHAWRAAGVLVEPIQGEGGLRFATPRFFRRLRLLTRICGVPLMLDEVQTGGGSTGRFWAHEHVDLPCPPDAVTWAKKAQNGVLFVSEELASFFQEEKKFNTTWEGDSAGMVRLIAFLEHLDLAGVRRTGELARAELEALARDHRGLVQAVRGAGVLLAFDLARPDWRDPLRERAFSRGLILLPAGERTLRFYPRHDMEPGAVKEAAAILRLALGDLLAAPPEGCPPMRPERRAGAVEVRPDQLEEVVLGADGAENAMLEAYAVEAERYGNAAMYPDGIRRADAPLHLLQYPMEVLRATLAHPRAIGLALRDRASGRIVAYALGSPLEHHDEEGVADDPHRGTGEVFYLQAMAVSPVVRHAAVLERMLLEAVRGKAARSGFRWLSILVEERVVADGPDWLRVAPVLHAVDDYLRSGLRFLYAQAPCDA